MSYTSVLDLFKVGIGPSSSHTVGPMLAAADFVGRLTGHPERLEVSLYGSLAFTGPGHGTEGAILLGLMGHQPDTVPLDLVHSVVADVDAAGIVQLPSGPLTFDRERDLVPVFEIHPAHANVLRFTAGDLSVAYASIGGGFIAELVDDELPPPSPPPTVPHPFESAADVLRCCGEQDARITDLVWENEVYLHGEATVEAHVDEVVSEMLEAIDRGMATTGNLPGGLAVQRRAKELGLDLVEPDPGHSLPPTGPADWAGVFATAVSEENAAGSRIVTAPTNGAAGIVPAVLRFMRDFCQPVVDHPERVFLLTASGVGALIKQGAGISGAELGCQAEVGAACAMAAAGLTAALGGSPAHVENAAEIALEHNLGLTCDPIGGLVQVPCIERNAVGAIKAIAAASMSLRGTGAHLVPLDSAIETMRQTGVDMHAKYKETSLGGLAVNVTAC
ncbi:MAG: L-serine ammonia-lyase [Acidimicrobiia bacterium]|nr:MAG: L-serine ammonia-lyase [Acidimicrobiia bacterium]